MKRNEMILSNSRTRPTEIRSFPFSFCIHNWRYLPPHYLVHWIRRKTMSVKTKQVDRLYSYAELRLALLLLLHASLLSLIAYVMNFSIIILILHCALSIYSPLLNLRSQQNVVGLDHSTHSYTHTQSIVKFACNTVWIFYSITKNPHSNILSSFLRGNFGCCTKIHTQAT